MRPHTWTLDGTMSDGEPRRRCSRCGMLGHWAGARDACPWLDNASVSRLATMDAVAREVVSGETTTTQWEGPYRRHRWLTCKRCSARFRHPKRFRIIGFCGPVCVRENELERGRAYSTAYAARKLAKVDGAR